MTVRLEHANLCVRDIKGMIRFLQTAFPEFRVRGEGISNDGTRWVHIGTHETYIALGQSMAEPAKHWKPYQGLPGVMLQCVWQILSPDGKYIGTLIDTGITGADHIVVGGAGAFQGMTGLHLVTEAITPQRQASS